jgi:hypothetical protein
MQLRTIASSAIACASLLVVCPPARAQAGAAVITNKAVRVQADPGKGEYVLYSAEATHSVIRARFAAEINGKWIHSSDYPKHTVSGPSKFSDFLGAGDQLLVEESGLAGTPNLVCTLRLYNDLPYGTVQVRLLNSSGRSVTVQDIRSLDAVGKPLIDLGGAPISTRVLSDSFSEDRPVLKIRDWNDPVNGMHRATGSQLFFNRESGESVFLGTLSSDRFLTLLHLRGTKDAHGAFEPASYTVDSTGTTEILKEESLSGSPTSDQIELSMTLAAGERIDSESLMFAVGNDYHQQLENYGAAIRKLHNPRPAPEPLIGWWSWTAYYFAINEGAALTNAEWMAEHLKNDGYVYVHLDEGYDYARGEYTTPDESHFPHGIEFISRKLAQIGLKLGVWTAPFEVSERSWVYQNHKDWLVKNAEHQPIHIGHVTGKLDQLYVLDTTNPGAQGYLRKTYETLAHDWHVRYIKMDFMDDTAIEGFYYKPNTTALEAQRIGLKIIREAVGDDVVLDKDGSVMLNPVGFVDTGRISADTGHAFEVIRDDAAGIAARYYMNRNFFVADPDAYSVSKQLVIDPDWHERVRPMTENEAQVAITLAAVAGGMFELGDDLPALGEDQDRVALVRNQDLLDMIRLGRSATPVDLLTYRPEDEQPSIFVLHESPHQSILAVFNWTEHASSHHLALREAGLDSNGSYDISDVFDSAQRIPTQNGVIELSAQPPHSVRVLKIMDRNQPARPPRIIPRVRAEIPVATEMDFSAQPENENSTATIYHWHFDDGVTTDGPRVRHAFTLTGAHHVVLHVESADGAPFAKTFDVSVTGHIDTHFKPEQNRRFEP